MLKSYCSNSSLWLLKAQRYPNISPETLQDLSHSPWYVWPDNWLSCLSCRAITHCFGMIALMAEKKNPSAISVYLSDRETLGIADRLIFPDLRTGVAQWISQILWTWKRSSGKRQQADPTRLCRNSLCMKVSSHMAWHYVLFNNHLWAN